MERSWREPACSYLADQQVAAQEHSNFRVPRKKKKTQNLPRFSRTAEGPFFLALTWCPCSLPGTHPPYATGHRWRVQGNWMTPPLAGEPRGKNGFRKDGIRIRDGKAVGRAVGGRGYGGCQERSVTYEITSLLPRLLALGKC